MNIKCCLWELSEGLLDNFELKEDSLSYKFFEARKCFWTIICTIRLKKLVSEKKEKFSRVKELMTSQSHDLMKTSRSQSVGDEMYKRMMVMSSYSNTYALELITYFKECGDSEQAFKTYFGRRRVSLYPIVPFSFGSSCLDTAQAVEGAK
jgi:hypothetical protein